MVGILGEGLDLHDCRAASARLEGEQLTFDFPDGIWRVDGEAFRTGPAQVSFSLPDGEDGVELAVYTRLTARRSLCTLWSLPRLARCLARGGELEFLYRYTGWQAIEFDCWLWQNRRHRVCRLSLSADRGVCRWD